MVPVVDNGLAGILQMRKGDFNHDAKSQLYARTLRGEMSASEKRLWARLRRDQTGYHFRTQVRVDRYFLDFYCSSARLCVEVDGEQHGSQKAYDARRDQILCGCRIETIRIPSLDLFDDSSSKLDDWLTLIAKRCEARTNELGSLRPMGRRRKEPAESPTPNPLPQRQATLRDGASNQDV